MNYKKWHSHCVAVAGKKLLQPMGKFGVVRDALTAAIDARRPALAQAGVWLEPAVPSAMKKLLQILRADHLAGRGSS
jgi:hypothetical protein